jgi:hypothetical protein
MSDDDMHRVMLAPPTPSLSPTGRITQQVGLMLLLGAINLGALIGAIYGVVEKPTLSLVVSSSVGGILALLNGGARAQPPR